MSSNLKTNAVFIKYYVQCRLVKKLKCYITVIEEIIIYAVMKMHGKHSMKFEIYYLGSEVLMPHLEVAVAPLIFRYSPVASYKLDVAP
jgi:hypothetical protein